jgi:predicted glutamine amidotransferase
MAGQIGIKEEKMLRTLLILDTLRGEDSTGIAAIPKQGDVIVAKELGNPFELFASRKFETAMKKVNRAIIGHNRFATSGGVSKKTAHPFDFDTLVGVHNGTLRNKWHLADATDFTVDSENLYHHIEKHGLKDALNVVDGAYALVWWDKLEETLNILRNKERPMYMTASEDNKTMFCASESWMLTIAANRADIKIQDIITTVEDMQYSIFIGKDGVLEKPKVKHMPSTYVAPVYQNSSANWHGKYYPNNQQSNVAPFKVVGALPPPVVEEKKIIPAGSVAYYVGKKDLQLEVMGKMTDKNGSVFISLMDNKWPSAPLRMYPHKKDPRSYTIGREIVGEISAFLEGEGYFKVSPHNIRMLPEKKPDLFLFDDGKGHKLNKKEWEEKYPNCDWCFDPLFAEDHGNRLNGVGGCFCGKCAALPEANEYLKLKPVY